MAGAWLHVSRFYTTIRGQEAPGELQQCTGESGRRLLQYSITLVVNVMFDHVMF